MVEVFRSALMASGGLLLSASRGLFSLPCKGVSASYMSGISLGGGLLSSSVPEVFCPPFSLLFLASEQLSTLVSDRSVRDLSITSQFPSDGI